MKEPTPAPVTNAPAADRLYLLERVGEAAVVQVYADGFRDLPLRERTLVWHLGLEAIVTHSSGIDRSTLDEIVRYTKLFWINTGPYNNLTSRKFVLPCTTADFVAAAQ